jgi:hypothetical protein
MTEPSSRFAIGVGDRLLVPDGHVLRHRIHQHPADPGGSVSG